MKVKPLMSCMILGFFTQICFTQQASLSGKFNTTATKSWISENQKLIIENDSKAKVQSFSIAFTGTSMWESPSPVFNDSIPDSDMQKIFQLRKGDKIFFKNIMALNKDGNPIKATDFYLKITDIQVP